MKTNTLMAHKSRRCLDIFLCVSILQISHLFCFTWYSFDCFSFYATIMCELPKNALYTVCRYAPLLFFLHLWIWTVAILTQPLWVPVGFTVKSFLFFCTHVTCYNPASKMATVPLKVTWKVSVNIALSLAFILAELNPERKFSPEIPNSHKTAWKPQVFF